MGRRQPPLILSLSKEGLTEGSCAQSHKARKDGSLGRAVMPRTDYWNSNNPDIRNSMAAMRRAAAMA